MIEFTYKRATDTATAIRLARDDATAKFLGGGTNLLDLMREGNEAPTSLVDITRLPSGIDAREDGSVRIDAATRNTALAEHRAIRERFPVIAQAILAGASGQIRNMATVGGNVLQRTRCHYFYDDAARCNKRERGAGCDAVGGFNRIHAVLGASPSCVATHPSDMCVALAALDAVIHLDGPEGPRTMPFTAFHRLPGETPDVETELRRHELITAIELPSLPFATRSTYRKVRDRASYAFALVSVAAAIDVAEDGVVCDVRIALGGVAHKPWRAVKAEAALKGARAASDSFRDAAEAELADAVPLRDNAFKPELARRTIVSALLELTRENLA